VDPQPVTRHGLRAFVEDNDIEICGEKDDASSLLADVRQMNPHVVVLSRHLEDGHGFAAMVELREHFPELPVIILAEIDYSTDLAMAHQLGAVGLLAKSVDRERFVAAIHAAAKGRTLWSRADVRRITGAAAFARTDQLSDGHSDVPLTQREVEVVRGMTEGWTNRQIADHLSISPETVKEHVQHALTKIGVEDRTQAAVWAVRMGIA
jgi:DNA-binding NarL/FixJ family response regulator